MVTYVGGDIVFWYLISIFSGIFNLFLYVVACSHKSEGCHL